MINVSIDCRSNKEQSIETMTKELEINFEHFLLLPIRSLTKIEEKIQERKEIEKKGIYMNIFSCRQWGQQFLVDVHVLKRIEIDKDENATLLLMLMTNRSLDNNTVENRYSIHRQILTDAEKKNKGKVSSGKKRHFSSSYIIDTDTRHEDCVDVEYTVLNENY